MSTPPRLDEATEEELAQMLAERRAESNRGRRLYDMEIEGEAAQRRDQQRTLQRAFDHASQAESTEAKPCPRCQRPCPVKRASVRKTLRSVDGELNLRRNYHYCNACGAGFYPLDAELGLPDEGTTTARMTQLILDMGLHSTFVEAAARFTLHHGVAISENLVRCVIDQMGHMAADDPMFVHRVCPPATTIASMLVVSVDGSMISTRGADPWRETKVGVVARDEHFVQNKARGEITAARYAARMSSLEDFRRDMTRLLSLEHAWDCASVAFVGDGAPWVWNLADEICPNAVQILDWTHAVEYAADVGSVLFPDDAIMTALWCDVIKKHLFAGRVERVIAELEECAFGLRGAKRDALVTIIRYYTNQRTRMRYDVFRLAGLPCGSGCVESAHRHVLQKRMKLAGQHWDPDRADRLAQLRAALATTGPANIFHAISA